MIIFLYGPDAYRLKQNVKKVVESYRKKNKNGLSFFDFNFLNPEEIKKAANAFRDISLFNELKLVTVNNSFSGKNSSESLFSLINSLSLDKDKNSVLLVVENQNSKNCEAQNKELFKFLARSAKPVMEFKYLEGNQLLAWAGKEFDLRKISVEPGVLKKLILLTGNDSWRIANETEKLINFSRGGKITADQVELLVSENSNLNIFNFIDALGDKNKAKAFNLLFGELKSGRDPHYILTMIAYQFRNMMIIKDLTQRSFSSAAVAKKSAIHPFVVRKMSSMAAKFSLEDLKDSFGKLLSLDIGSKSGFLDLEDSLYSFVLG